MDRTRFERRGWICAALAPVACVLFLLGRMTGLWARTGNQLAAVLAGILMVEMAAGAVAPFWWLLTALRRPAGLSPSKPLIIANIAAMIISIVFFF